MAFAQIPQCNNDSIAYYISAGFISNPGEIYSYNPYLPVSASNPLLNSINAATGLTSGNYGVGLALGKNINATTPATTFYIVGYPQYYLYYYDGAQWVNTGELMPGTNIGIGNRYLFIHKDNTGDIYRYDGNGSPVYLTTVDGFGSDGGPNDVVVDEDDNWYSLRTKAPGQFLRKYNSEGVLLHSWTLVNAPSTVIGAGFSIVNNRLFYTSYGVQNFNILGTIGSDSVVITSIESVFSDNSLVIPADWANCIPASTVAIRLLSFNAYNFGSSNKLEWIAENELSNEYFNVEKSKDGISWSNIGKVNCLTYPGQNRYSFYDPAPFSENTYYRLNQFYSNGFHQYSAVKRVKSNTGLLLNAVVYPSPDRNKVEVQFQLSKPGDVEFTIHNSVGNLMLRKSVKGSTGRNTINIPLSSFFSGGYYYIKISTASECKTLSFIK